jgi:epoxyqueuosine reductase
MEPHTADLFSKIEEKGWKGEIVPINRLADLKETIFSRRNAGLINEVLYQEQLSFFSFDPPAEPSNARSVLIVAVPTPQVRIFFHWNGDRVPVIIPPTYVSYSYRTAKVQAILASWLQNEGYNMAKPDLPLKTLAVCSGLASYGRNNICYVEGMGSFLQLIGAYSDMPCKEDLWRKPVRMERCQKCTACLNHCPTRAISRDRFLLYADRCLTYHNESTNDFPDWINPFCHHCLVGCMQCQTICPVNNDVKNWYEDRAEFSEQETALLIKGVPPDQLPDETFSKMKNLELNADYSILCRNLSLIIKREVNQN